MFWYGGGECLCSAVVEVSMFWYGESECVLVMWR